MKFQVHLMKSRRRLTPEIGTSEITKFHLIDLPLSPSESSTNLEIRTMEMTCQN